MIKMQSLNDRLREIWNIVMVNKSYIRTHPRKDFAGLRKFLTPQNIEKTVKKIKKVKRI